MTQNQALKKYFGHSKFRAHQSEAVKSIIERKDTLMVVSTGTGKSLCYQLPGLMSEGITIVVSPLISLMQDQVNSLEKRGIKAELIAAYMEKEEAWKIRDDAIAGKIKFLFVSPERVVTDRFQDFLKRLNINSFAIDEAHCLSQWGNDFRSSYMSLGKLKENFPDACITAFTASATEKVRKDILKVLKMESPNVIVGSTFRKNINISVEERSGKGYPRLMKLIKKHKDKPGIIYSFSRKDVDKISRELQKRGVDAAAYHAGMTDAKRKVVLDKFMADEIRVVVATVAFGMGIDKPDIRFVCHMHTPRSMEGYYQEIGRSGRDGKESDALLLFSYGDIKKIEFLIKKNDPEETKNEHLYQIDMMREYVYSYKCRHVTIGKHFQDKMKDCKTKCDNCA
jgi:ATP-dependent DNA helicase RecQ